MNFPRDGTNQLPKAGCDWIALKVIFQGRKGLNLRLFSNFDTYYPFIQNLFSEEKDWITLKVIAKVTEKVRFSSFSHISLY